MFWIQQSHYGHLAILCVPSRHPLEWSMWTEAGPKPRVSYARQPAATVNVSFGRVSALSARRNLLGKVSTLMLGSALGQDIVKLKKGCDTISPTHAGNSTRLETSSTDTHPETRPMPTTHAQKEKKSTVSTSWTIVLSYSSSRAFAWASATGRRRGTWLVIVPRQVGMIAQFSGCVSIMPRAMRL